MEETPAAHVTWLLPIKNGMPYLPETLASIEAQTYRNWQVLAWDNGSTDATLEELHHWIPSRLPGRIVSNRPMGLGASLAAMVQEADTDLCARIDADDVSLPERLEKQVAFLETHPEVAIVGTQIQVIDEAGILQEAAFTLPCSHTHLVHFLFSGWGFYHPTVLFRRSAVLEVGNYRDVGAVNVEDVDLWFRLLTKYQGANLNEALLRYRVHAGSVTIRDAKLNRLHSAGNARFCEHAPLLFGLRSAQALKWREHRHLCAIFLLLHVVRHLQHTQGGHWTQHLRCEWFLDSARKHVATKDIITRLTLALLDRRHNAFRNEVSALRTALNRKISPTKSMV